MLTLEIPLELRDAVLEVQREDPARIHFATKRSFGGVPDIITALIYVTPALAPFITKLVLESIRARKFVRVSYAGILIEGVSERTLPALLTSIIALEESKTEKELIVASLVELVAKDRDAPR